MSKVLITGATGFIGNHVTRLCLERGDDVRVMVMPGEDRSPLDGLDVEYVESKKSWVVDLARGSTRLQTHLEPEDANDCMEGKQCVYLGTKDHKEATANDLQILAEMAITPQILEPFLSIVSNRAQAAAEMKTAASEKSRLLLDLSRILLPFCHPEAKGIFVEAMSVAEEADEEDVYRFPVIATSARLGVEAIPAEKRKSTAVQLSTVALDSAVRLGDHDAFPWSALAESLATLDTFVAFSTAAKWSDLGVAQLSVMLPGIIASSLNFGHISPEQGAALSVLIPALPPKVARTIVESAVQRCSPSTVSNFS